MTSSTTSSYRIKGPWLLLARAIWIILAFSAVVIIIAGVSELYSSWLNCEDCSRQDQALANFGLTRNFYAIYFPIGVIVEVLPWILTGVLIFWKKSDEPFGLLFSLMMVLVVPLNADSGIRESAVSYYPTLLSVSNGMTFIGAALIVLWYCFPDGRFVPRWLRWFAVLWVAIQSVDYFLRDAAFNLYNLPDPWSNMVDPLIAISVIYSMIYRYSHTIDPAQKQQIK